MCPWDTQRTAPASQRNTEAATGPEPPPWSASNVEVPASKSAQSLGPRTRSERRRSKTKALSEVLRARLVRHRSGPWEPRGDIPWASITHGPRRPYGLQRSTGPQRSQRAQRRFQRTAGSNSGGPVPLRIGGVVARLGL